MHIPCRVGGRTRDLTRDAAILDAALQLLSEVGYDQVTMEAVAARARAGKATLYRRWTSKAELLVDAVTRLDADYDTGDVDTGSLRGDLLAQCSGHVPFTDTHGLSAVAGLMTVLRRDPQLAALFDERLFRPRLARLQEVFARAQRRGEVRADADLALLTHIIPAQIWFRKLFGTEPIDADFIARVVDTIVLPAAMATPCPGSITGTVERDPSPLSRT